MVLAIAEHTVDEGTLRNSNFEMKYRGQNTYTFFLYVRDEDNNRVYEPLERLPILRLTSECAGSTFSYCRQSGHSHHQDMDWVSEMDYQGKGVYFKTVDFEEGHGTITPLVYALYDSNFNQNVFKAGSNMRHSDQYMPGKFESSSLSHVPL